ncbi:MAG: hypothetical protein K2L52_04045, partial [Clostridia bacterium]|nr:hypothetical protein [Clostridia bacterium]
IASTGVTGDGFGLFCKVNDATITDLILEDFNYSDIPASYSHTVINHGPLTGSIVGVSVNSTSGGYMLNCHVTGEITGGALYTGGFVRVSGLQGFNASGSMVFYRCSADTSLTAGINSGTYNILMSGLIGQSYSSDASTLKLSVYDCVTKTNITNTSTRTGGIHFGACVGHIVGSALIENFLGYIDLTTSAFSTWGGSIAGVGGSATLRNCYGYGIVGASNNKLSTYAIASENVPPTLGNVYNVKSTNSYSLASNWNGYEGTVKSNLSDLITTAYGDVGTKMSSQVWDKEKTGNLTGYWDGNYTGNETILDYSPVRNYLMAFINFRNLTNGGNSEEKVGLDDGDGYVVGDKLPDELTAEGNFLTYLNNKANSNHEFKGWTDDPTGVNEPFTELPSGLFGDVTLYAVWGLPDSYVKSNIKTSLTADKSIIEYDSVESITLTAKVTHTSPSSGSMTNPSATYYFVQDGEEKTTSANVKSSGVLSVKTVKDSGKYTFKYRLTDGLEPLWYYDGTPSNSVDIKIEKGKLEHMTLKDFKISTSTIPYFGKKLEDIDFTASMLNNGKKEVQLASMRWKSTIGKVDTKGTNTKKIVLCPTDTDNYEEEYVFDATFESQSLVIIFNMAQISQKVEVEVEYGQNYGSAEIIYLFQQAYLKALSEWDAEIVGDVSSMAPYLDGKALVDGDANADKFDTEYNGINEIHTIQVTFKDASYEVVFNPDNGGTSSPTKETYGYGQFLKKPTPDPVNGEMLFLGWYFDDITIDDNGNEVTTSRAWRFNSVGNVSQDRVTKAVTLTAKWLKADKLDSIKVELDPSKKYIAQTGLQEGDLIVTATYSGTLDDNHVEQDVVLSWSQFSSGITYATIDKLLHVTQGGYTVTVSYTYGSQTKTDSVDINVLPISVNTGKLTFADKTIIYDGTDTNVTIDPIKGTLPSEIINVTYVYTKNGQPVDVADVKGLGTWVVQAVFETDSTDYYAEPMLATLKVVRPTALEKPTFTGGVTYDGTEKNIEDYLNDFDPDYMK